MLYDDPQTGEDADGIDDREPACCETDDEMARGDEVEALLNHLLGKDWPRSSEARRARAFVQSGETWGNRSAS